MSDAFAPGLAHPPPNRQPTDPSPPRGDGARRAGRSWSTALPPSSHAVESPQPIRRGGLPHLDGLQTTVRALFELDRR